MGGPETQGLLRGKQIVLQVQNALADMKAGAEFQGVKGFGEVIIRAQVEALEEIPLLAARGKQQHIDIRRVFALAEPLANLDSFHLRHHPVQDSQARGVRAIENAQSL